MSTVLNVKDLCKTYIVNKRQNNVLNNVDFKVEEGEMIAVMGPSGSGKSTLLYTVSGMDRMTAGKVFFGGKDISAMNSKELSQLRLTEMGFIFQQMYMMKKLCVMDNIVLPAYQAGKSRSESNAKAEALMRRLGIIDIAEREINEVSGGQLQRACLCRALINDPKVIFADEPTGQLNSAASRDVLDIFSEVHKNGQSIVMVTHDLKTALRGTRVLYLRDGGVVGDYEMPVYGEDDIKERRAKLSEFLESMGW
jgi:putative ABC transport system ATP-binding protein